MAARKKGAHPEVAVFSDRETVARVKLVLELGADVRVRVEKRDGPDFARGGSCREAWEVVVIEAVPRGTR